ncbi:MAG TPA: hypothetical protein VNL77_09285 [Roseiflexaceae bacterium]|nr:hypothetical protein [Roseiflexaceae bacterium]
MASWSPAERWSYRRQLTALAAWLGLLYRRWVVAAYLAAVLALVMVIAAASGGALTDSSAGVLLAVLSAILLPPFAICNGIAGDYTAAQALLAACHSAGDARADPRSPKECDHV